MWVKIQNKRSTAARLTLFNYGLCVRPHGDLHQDHYHYFDKGLRKQTERQVKFSFTTECTDIMEISYDFV